MLSGSFCSTLMFYLCSPPYFWSSLWLSVDSIWSNVGVGNNYRLLVMDVEMSPFKKTSGPLPFLPYSVTYASPPRGLEMEKE